MVDTGSPVSLLSARLARQACAAPPAAPASLRTLDGRPERLRRWARAAVQMAGPPLCADMALAPPSFSLPAGVGAVLGADFLRRHGLSATPRGLFQGPFALAPWAEGRNDCAMLLSADAGSRTPSPTPSEGSEVSSASTPDMVVVEVPPAVPAVPAPQPALTAVAEGGAHAHAPAAAAAAAHGAVAATPPAAAPPAAAAAAAVSPAAASAPAPAAAAPA